MTIALVTGPIERLHAVADALRSQGLSTVLLDHRELNDRVRSTSAPNSSPTLSSLADIAPDLSFCDWRTEVFSLTSGIGSTYFGWPTADGRWCTAVLRGAVLSPLRPFDGPAAQDPAEGSREVRAALFARAVISDAGGNTTRCARCGGAGCGACHACGLAKWAGQLVDDFVQEILPSFPTDGIEIAAADVDAWLRARKAALAAVEKDGRSVAHIERAVHAQPTADLFTAASDSKTGVRRTRLGS